MHGALGALRRRLSSNKTNKMSNNQGQKPDIDRYVVIHVATTCDEHGVYVTKDSAEVIEIGWLLLDAKNCEEVSDLLAVSVIVKLTLLPAAPGKHSREARQHTNHTVVQ